MAKKLDTMSEEELAETFGKMSRNFVGKATKENRVFSTSTSPLFAIDTWRAVNPTAASTYNTYMIINTKKCPGILADGRTSKGDKLVNTRSNQEAILAPNRLVYRKLEYDKKRKMFAITVDAEYGVIMDKDYNDFVERMGSFEDELDIGDIGLDDKKKINIDKANEYFKERLQKIKEDN